MPIPRQFLARRPLPRLGIGYSRHPGQFLAQLSTLEIAEFFYKYYFFIGLLSWIRSPA